MAADPITALETGLYNKLAGTSALITELGGTAIFNKRVPQSPASKYVLFQGQGGPGDENSSPHRTLNVIYTVQGVATTQAAAAAIDDEIDTALHNQTLTVTGWTNFWMAREQPVNYAEEDSAGVVKFHVGAQYRIRLDKNS